VLLSLSVTGNLEGSATCERYTFAPPDSFEVNILLFIATYFSFNLKTTKVIDQRISATTRALSIFHTQLTNALVIHGWKVTELKNCLLCDI